MWVKVKLFYAWFKMFRKMGDSIPASIRQSL